VIANVRDGGVAFDGASGALMGWDIVRNADNGAMARVPSHNSP
jgi:hypothetical protein